jgi:hypothetical protein
MDGGLGVSRMKRRTRRQYDERRDLDDLDGVDDVRVFFLLLCSYTTDEYIGNPSRTTE